MHYRPQEKSLAPLTSLQTKAYGRASSNSQTGPHSLRSTSGKNAHPSWHARRSGTTEWKVLEGQLHLLTVLADKIGVLSP